MTNTATITTLSTTSDDRPDPVPPADPFAQAVAAIDAAPIPFDLYREVHKGLRLALFQVTTSAGSADHTDPAARATVAAQVDGLVGLLHAHHHHEDVHIAPVLAAHAARLAAIVADDHVGIDAKLAALGGAAATLVASDGGAAVAAGLALYRRLALFGATYVAHMALEEGAVMDALRGALSTGELFTIEVGIRSSVPPLLMCDFIACMAPAMNIDERTSMLGGMQAGAPPEIFELFRGAIEAALTPADYRAVAQRIGVA